jgi:C1A family cysteine protease
MKFRFGWTPDVPDHRDRPLKLEVERWKLPSSADLRAKMPPVYDQGDLGSCTANAIAAAIQYARRKQSFPDDFMPSRLFVYYNEREMEGTVDVDAGAMIRDGIKSIGRYGDLPETGWPYEISMFDVKPGRVCYDEAIKYRALDYWRVPRSLVQMKGCLAAGFPFVFGFSVYGSLWAAENTGLVPMPDKDEQLLGGHAVLAVGYNDAMKMANGPAGGFIVRNSWGAGWGAEGYFFMPYAFLMDENLSDDFWCLKVEAA